MHGPDQGGQPCNTLDTRPPTAFHEAAIAEVQDFPDRVRVTSRPVMPGHGARPYPGPLRLHYQQFSTFVTYIFLLLSFCFRVAFPPLRPFSLTPIASNL